MRSSHLLEIQPESIPVLHDLGDIVRLSSNALHLEHSELILDAPNLVDHRLDVWILVQYHLQAPTSNCHWARPDQ